MEAVAVGGLKRARGGAYNGPEATAAVATLKKLRLDAATAAAAAAAAAAMNMPPTGHTPPLVQQQQQAAQGAANAVSMDGQGVVTGMCNSIDSVGPGEEEVNDNKTITDRIQSGFFYPRPRPKNLIDHILPVKKITLYTRSIINPSASVCLVNSRVLRVKKDN